MKSKLFFTSLAAIVFAGCATTAKPMPELSKLVERENEIGIGITGPSKNGGVLLVEYEDKSFDDWSLLVVKDDRQKALLEDVFMWQKSDGTRGTFPPVMTVDEYAARLNQGEAPKPGPEPGSYQSMDGRIAQLRVKLEKYPAVMYRYSKAKN